MTTSLPRRIDASEARIGDLVERRHGESRVGGRYTEKIGEQFLGIPNVLLWRPDRGNLGWELWLLDRPETTTERFTREALAKSFPGPKWATFLARALEGMWAAGWTVTPPAQPADAELEVQ